MAIPNLKLRKPSAKYCDQVITLKLSELFGHSKSKIVRRKKCILVIYLEQVLCFEMSLYRRTFWQNSELHFHQLWNRTVSIRTINTNWNPAVLRALHDFLTTKTLWLILLDFSLLLFDLRRSRLTLCCKDTLYFSTIVKLFLNSSDLNEIKPCNLCRSRTGTSLYLGGTFLLYNTRETEQLLQNSRHYAKIYNRFRATN